eukprot:Skav209922  [mRNA]  locus=scaffold1253:168477:170033:+ [translate_table: standard]
MNSGTCMNSAKRIGFEGQASNVAAHEFQGSLTRAWIGVVRAKLLLCKIVNLFEHGLTEVQRHHSSIIF